MSKLDQIQNELKSINQAKFQKLCDSYLYRVLDAKEIESKGSVVGKEKTRTGTPDTILTLQNDKKVFVEATTQNSGLLAKFSEDLDKCFDTKKTGIALTKIEKVILACNSNLLSEGDKKALRKQGKKKNCKVEFLELETLSFELLQKFQPLAKEYLQIDLDTGQILKPTDFVNNYQHNKFATKIDNKFLFREDEKKELLKVLENQDLIILSGKAGVGKTKLALQCSNEFVKSNPNYQPFFITNKNNQDINENLKAYFGADGDYLIVVDDANHLQLSLILQLLTEQTVTRKIKFVLTVRDYALNQVRDKSKKYSFHEIELQKFSDEEISKILEEGFGIRNGDFIDRINRISKGNARLAVMAANVVDEKKTLQSINDASDLYDIYFDSVNEDLRELGNKDLLKIAGIISFFRVLDKTNSEFFEKVAQLFGLTSDELWTGLEKLNDLEVVDLGYEVAKISDQILGTYLFYKAFFKDKILDFSLLLNDFERFSHRLIDSLNPVLDTFNTESIMEKLRPHIIKGWEEIKDDEAKALAFIKLFYYLDETRFLLYLKKQIDLLKKVKVKESELKFTPRNYEPINDKYVEVLKLFQSENIGITLDLIFNLLEKDLNLLPQVIQLLTHNFCFNHYSHYWNYLIQQTVISKLIEKSKGKNTDLYKKIFLQVAGKYSQMSFHSDSSNGLQITLYNFKLRPVESMSDLRESMWKRLVEIYREGKYQTEVAHIIKNYNQSWHKDYIVKEIIEKDVEILLPLIASLNPKSYQGCVLVNSFLDFLEHVDVSFDKKLRSKFTNKTYKISEVLLSNDRREWKMGFDKYEKHKNEVLKSYFKNYTLEDYKELFRDCEEIQASLKDGKFYQLHSSLTKVLLNLSETNKELFIDIINYTIESGNKLYLSAWNFIHKFIEKSSGLSNVYESIKNANFNAKNDWLLNFFQFLPKESVNKYFLEELYEFYRKANLREIKDSFDYLENYLDIDTNVISKVVEILYERIKNGEGDFNFSALFNYSGVSKKLEQIFKKKINLLKEIYLYQHNIERYHDHDSKAFKQIFMLDRKFLFEYMEFLLKESSVHSVLSDGNTNFSFIWDQPDYEKLFTSLLEFLYKKENKNRNMFNPSFIEILLKNFMIEPQNETVKKEIERQKKKAVKLLKKILKENAKDKRKANFIFQLVINCFGDKKKEFLEVFIKANKDFEDFKYLGLEFQTNHIVMADMGSSIPRYENKIKFYDSLLPLFDSIDLLDHKAEIQKKINNYNQRIEDEKKRDFIGYF